MLDIITVGDCTIDTFLFVDNAELLCGVRKKRCQLCFTYADKIPIARSAQSIGGGAANVAIGCARLGLKTAIATQLGDDMSGHAVRARLMHEGVDTAHARFVKKADTRYSVILVYKGERTILSHFAPRRYELPPIPQTQYIYYTSHGKTFERLQKQLIAYLTKHPRTHLAFNPGSYQLRHGRAAVRSLLPETDTLFVNVEEAQAILGKQDKPEAMCRALSRRGVGCAVITDGGRGAYAFDGARMCRDKALGTRAKEKTGAGDAFASGFISARARGESIATAMRWGTKNAGHVVACVGAQDGLLTYAGMVSAL